MDFGAFMEDEFLDAVVLGGAHDGDGRLEDDGLVVGVGL